MRFWDTSALVATLLDEPATARLAPLVASDPDIAVWALTPVEADSAIARRARAGELDPAGRALAESRLAAIEARWEVVDALVAVVRTARALVRRYPLRAADAAQLSAALTACDGRPAKLPLVTLDDRLAAAARAEGFTVVP